MIYVISPYLSDVIRICEREGINCPVQAGHMLNPNVCWIYHWQQLAGRKIFKVDRILYGDLINRFEVDALEAINKEIEIRKKYS